MLNVGRIQINLIEYSLQGNAKIFSWNILELIIKKLENFIIFRNPLERGHMSPSYDPPWPINKGPPPRNVIYPRAC